MQVDGEKAAAVVADDECIEPCTNEADLAGARRAGFAGPGEVLQSRYVGASVELRKINLVLHLVEIVDRLLCRAGPDVTRPELEDIGVGAGEERVDASVAAHDCRR